MDVASRGSEGASGHLNAESSMGVVSRSSVVQVVGTRDAVQLACQDLVKGQLVLDGMIDHFVAAAGLAQRLVI